MADTRQIVEWTLGQTCKLRKGSEVSSPEKALGAVARARAYSRGLRNNKDGFGVFGDIYVSSRTSGYRPGPKGSKPSAPYPCGGFVISEAFKEMGGPSALFTMCSSCPANTTPNELAGCCGSLFQRPDSAETEKQIRAIIERLGIEDDVQSAFPPTTPIWYGLWAIDPVPRRSLPLLRTIVSEMRAEDARDMEAENKVDHAQLRDFALFVRAAGIAAQRSLPLHVSLAPLGHADFGFYTVFPHCPFCKAATHTAHWQRKYPSALYPCHVCGREYSPAETASQERMQDLEELRVILGPTRFRDFAREYLVTLGETSEGAESIVRETEVQEERRQEILRHTRELQAKKDAYLAEHIFVGLEPVSLPLGECVDDEAAGTPSRWFEGDVFAEVLRRCATHGIAIHSITHDSPDGNADRHEFGYAEIEDPLAVLHTLREEGCNGKFSASYMVPDKLVR